MGTHPIFESDFDCLTGIGNRKVIIMLKNSVKRTLTTSVPCASYRLVNPESTKTSLTGSIIGLGQSMFLTDIARGFGQITGKIFAEPATINYPFEKGPLFLVSVVNMLLEDIQLVKKDVLPANSAKLHV